MPAAVRIEAEAFADDRFGALALAAGLTDADHARGRMLRLWRHCTEHQVYVVPELVVIAVLGPTGPGALVEARLGEQVEGGIRMCGTKGRIEWLGRLRENATRGGEARQRQARRKPDGYPDGYPDGSQMDTQKRPRRVPRSKPELSPPTPTTSTDLTSSDPRESAPGGAPAGESDDPVDFLPPELRGQPDQPDPEPQAKGEHQAFVDGFDRLFKAHYGGAAPRWGGAEGRMVKDLLAKGRVSAQEALRRARTMFGMAGRFPAEKPDLRTLVAHWDKFAGQASDPRVGRFAGASADPAAYPAPGRDDSF